MNYEKEVDWDFVLNNIFRFFEFLDFKNGKEAGKLSQDQNLILCFQIIQEYDVNISISRIKEKYEEITRKSVSESSLFLNKEYASWIDLLPQYCFFLPDEKDETLKRLKSLDYSDDFINNILLYPSGRPKQDLFEVTRVKKKNRTNEICILGLQFPHYIADLSNGEYHQTTYFPVVRYQKGMSGIYTSSYKKDREYCGTFYYFEPDSPYYLECQSCLSTKNKVTAAMELGYTLEEIVDIYVNYFTEYIDDSARGNTDLETYVNELTNSEKIKYYFEFIRNIDIGETNGYQFLRWWLDGLINNMPLRFQAKYYAFEDVLDQYICNEATNKKIEVILLKYMTGGNRVVSEVLDTRTRKQSFNSIVFPPILTYD